MSGFGAWRTECDDCDGSCNTDQGRGQCPDKREPMFDKDPVASMFIASVMVAGCFVAAMYLAGVWA